MFRLSISSDKCEAIFIKPQEGILHIIIIDVSNSLASIDIYSFFLYFHEKIWY